MRHRILLVALTVAVAFPESRLHAQCSPATQKLLDDDKFDEAKAEVDARLKRNAKDDAALHCMGRIYIEQDQPGDAIGWFEKATAANDTVSAHHLWLGNALGMQAPHVNKFKLPFLARRIKNEFDRSVQLDSTSVEARQGLIQFYSRAPGVMGGSMDKAKELALTVEKLDAWRGHVQMAQLLEHDKDLAGAEKEFLAAITAAPDSNGSYFATGSFYRRQKRWPDALAIYESLLKRKPNALNARLNIASTLVQSGTDYDRAETEVRAWLASPPVDTPRANFSVAHYLLGQVAEKAGKNDAARAQYQQALTFNLENREAKRALAALR
jgi:tetratricopeptide (TPR) repeat protein